MQSPSWRELARAAVLYLLLGGALASCGDAAASRDYDFTSTVTKIVDGDTFYLTGQDVRIGVWGLAAPERSDPDGPVATSALRELVADQTLGCKLQDKDRYGQPVAQCFFPAAATSPR